MSHRFVYSESISVDSFAGGDIIGVIHLSSYDDSNIYHVEYSIMQEEHRSKGVMTEALPKFLINCKKKGFLNIVAIVKNDNEASKKLLERNDFCLFKKSEEHHHYLKKLDLDSKIIKTVVNDKLFQTFAEQ